MPQKFRTEIRNIFEKEYIKVFLLNMSDSSNVQALLESLNCIHKVNVSNDGRNLTAYPSKLYTAKEASAEIASALDSYFTSSSNRAKSLETLTKAKETFSGHDKSVRLFEDSIKNISANGSNRATLDNVRLALERYLQEVLGNNNTLEHQEKPLKDFLKEKRATEDVRNGITTSLHNFYRYQNDHVKHDYDVKDEDVDYYINVANTIFQQIHKYE